ncbi:hypothetical protein P4V54_22395 [Brevibacillus nitrificans]|uniref:hypothetical protein n=1 Tax=Brevibacillus nitrificans TaxID=651560 RepID=UPI002E1D3D13|nr:hypothetical protein [Brevibacillus nitrificans]
MPTMANSLLPAPKDWSEFEEIVASCLRIRWGNKNIYRIGRKGQRQHGVDIFGDDDVGRKAGVQCKLTEGKLNLKIVDTEILKAEKFVPYLDIFYIATTAPRDSKLQEEIRVLSEERKKQQKFPIQLLFWEDLFQDLTSDLLELNKHYPELNLRIHNKEGKKTPIRISKKYFMSSIIVILLILLYFQKPDHINSALMTSYLILLDNKWGLILLFILLSSLLALLKISDLKFNKEKEEYNWAKPYESKEKKPITTIVFDRDEIDNGNWRILREIRIRNTTEYEIKCITGKVIFYDYDDKIDEVYFNEEVIPPRRGIRIEKLVENRMQKRWNEFHTEIKSMEFLGKTMKDVRIFGTRFYRTYYFLLNRYNYIEIFGKPILPYEITWLSEKRRQLWLKLMFMPSKWSRTEGLNNGLFWIRFRRRIMQGTVMLFLVSYLAYVIQTFLVVAYRLITCWFKAISLTLTDL